MSKTKPAPAVPRNFYGLDKTLDNGQKLPITSETSQLTIEKAAFAMRWPIEKGGLPRIQHYHNLLRILYPDYVPDKDDHWAFAQDESLCEKKWIAWPGCAGCVDGDTRLLNPITGEEPTIRELCEKQIAPVVMTLHGPVQAEIPFLKGFEDLFEVVLSNGSRFTTTAKHLVLTSTGFVPTYSLCVGQSLFAYDPVRLESISGRGLSVREQGASDFPRTTEDFQGRYSAYFHPDDEQLRYAIKASQSSFPSQDDVQGHNHQMSCSGDLASELGDIHSCPVSRHLSKNGSFLQNGQLDTPGQPPFHLGTFGYGECSSLSFSQSLEERNRLCPSEEPIPDSCKPRQFSVGSSMPYTNKVSQAVVVSIRKTKTDFFYDICIPEVHHYFAEGAIHHNSAKTCRASLFAVVWWLCAPSKSSVILTTTTKKALRQRAWAEVLKFYSMLPKQIAPGNMIQSQTIWQSKHGDDKQAIIGIAVEGGPIQKAVDGIKGVHTWRQLIIIDEATSCPEAVFEAAANLFTYPNDFQMLVIGNPFSRFDPLGKYCEPLNGWNSVSIETDSWESKTKPDGQPGHVIRFDAQSAPNIVHSRIVNRHQITKQKYDAACNGSFKDSPRFWAEFRGFWPPDGLTRTIFTESLLVKMDGFGRHVFSGQGKKKIAGLDPAFGGGNRITMRFGSVGTLESGQLALQVEEKVTLKISALNKNPVHFQLAEQAIAECRARGVSPEGFGIDSTGEGGGLADIIERLWARGIQRVEFGGKPSERRVSEVDARLCCDVYDRRVTELWYICREFMLAGQLKGIGVEDGFEFCNRQFDDHGKKIVLETKKEMKERMSGRSPDEADAVVVLTEVARRNGMQVEHATQIKEDSNWNDAVRVYDEVNQLTGTFD